MTMLAAPIPAPARASVRPAVERQRARSRATGAIVVTGFGALWGSLGAASAGAAVLVGSAVALVAVALAVWAMQVFRANPAVTEPLPADVAERARRGSRVFAWAVAGEGVGILLAVNLVVNLGVPQWRLPAIVLIVGLHFLPLAFGWRYRPHLVTGAALTAWALAWPWLLPAGGLSPAGPVVAGAMLFASAAWALRSAGRVEA